MARKETAADAANPGRLKQIALTYKMTRKADSKIGLVLAAVGIVTLGVFLAIGFLIGHPVYLGIFGLLLAFLATAIVFGRRAERAAFGQMEGQPGAAAAVLDNIGRGWTTTPAVAMNRSQDVVHRAVGKAGIVLVAEGNPNRVKSLLAAEKKKMARIVADVPVHDVLVGTGEGQVGLKKLRTTMLKYPRVLTGPQVTATNDRLRAMGDIMSNLPCQRARCPRGCGCREARRAEISCSDAPRHPHDGEHLCLMNRNRDASCESVHQFPPQSVAIPALPVLVEGPTEPLVQCGPGHSRRCLVQQCFQDRARRHRAANRRLGREGEPGIVREDRYGQIMLPKPSAHQAPVALDP